MSVISQSMLKEKITKSMQGALRARDKQTLGALRLILSAIQQREIDQREALDDEQVIAVLNTLVKQRKESLKQYEAGNRADLAAQEAFEIELIQTFLPEPLDETALVEAIQTAIRATAAADLKDMGKVMADLKPKLQGRADMAKVGQRVKQLLSQG